MVVRIARGRDNAKGLFGTEYVFLLCVSTALLLMPAMLVREVSGRFGFLARKKTIEAYALAKPALLGCLLLANAFHCRTSALFATVFLVDLYTYLTGLIFLRRFYTSPVSAQRSLILLGINFVESILGFAVLYGFFGALQRSGDAVAPIDALALAYFSLVTSTTVGFGDIIPICGGGRALVCLQIMASVVFLSVFVVEFVGRLHAEPPGPSK